MRKHSNMAAGIQFIRKGAGIMHFKIVFFWICLCLLIFLPLASGGERYAGDLNENVITALDEGGGDYSKRDIVLIILGAVGVFFLILMIFGLIYSSQMN